MTIERKQDERDSEASEATVQMPRPAPVAPELEDVDPEQTLVREDWESTVIRKVAPRVVAVAEGGEGEERFGWESEGLRRLSREVANVGAGK